MFDIGQYVFYGSEGICKIDDIVSSPFSDVKTDTKYYVLHSTHGGNSTAYVPVDGAERLIRSAMSKSDVPALISKIGAIELFSETNLKLLKDQYSVALRSGDPKEWVRIIETVNDRIINGRDGGKKVSDAEKSFADTAKKFLYKELSLALDIPEDAVESYIEKELSAVKS